MSETDSDLDFESADEDAEFASNIKKDAESEKCAKKVSSNRNQTSEPSKVVNETISEVKKCQVDKPNRTRSTDQSVNTEVLKESEHVEGNETVDKEVLKESEHLELDEIVDKEVLKENDHVELNETVDKLRNDKQIVSVEDIEIKPKEVTNTKEDTNVQSQGGHESEPANAAAENVPEKQTDQQCADPEFQPEKPRVMLRIEKKKQQKSQFTKEASVEKEKASDLVNILREEPPQPQFVSWGFSSWGTSLLTTAASSVSTFSNQVTQGIETVFETVESSLGAPAPEDLATALSENKKDDSSTETKNENDAKAGYLPDVSSWTKVFENTGSKVLFGGLDTLELIGKKTMDMLTEGDPGLRKKRAVFSDNKVNIAELLREARAKAEEQDQKDGLQRDAIHYSQIFDEKQGLAHLEALEMLSNQSQVKLQRLLMRHSKNMEVKKRLEEIKSICENIPSVDDLSDCENFEDFETVFKKHTLELSLPVNVENILKVQRQINDDIAKYESITEDSKTETKEVYRSAICSLAEFTAKCIETFHKVSELIIVQSRLQPDVEHCVTNLTGLTTVMCIEVNNVSAKYHKCLEAMDKFDENAASSEDLNVTTMATNLYVEAANSNKYIQDAYLMLVPVLQVCLLETLD